MACIRWNHFRPSGTLTNQDFAQRARVFAREHTTIPTKRSGRTCCARCCVKCRACLAITKELLPRRASLFARVPLPVHAEFIFATLSAARLVPHRHHSQAHTE